MNNGEREAYEKEIEYLKKLVASRRESSPRTRTG